MEAKCSLMGRGGIQWKWTPQAVKEKRDMKGRGGGGEDFVCKKFSETVQKDLSLMVPKKR